VELPHYLCIHLSVHVTCVRTCIVYIWMCLYMLRCESVCVCVCMCCFSITYSCMTLNWLTNGLCCWKSGNWKNLVWNCLRQDYCSDCGKCSYKAVAGQEFAQRTVTRHVLCSCILMCLKGLCSELFSSAIEIYLKLPLGVRDLPAVLDFRDSRTSRKLRTTRLEVTSKPLRGHWAREISTRGLFEVTWLEKTKGNSTRVHF
jgi:hypothetical protein